MTKKTQETRLSIAGWTIVELERWPPPPHARVSLFIYPVHHAAFPVTTGGGSGPRSAEVAAVGLIHCRWHLTARFVMFLDAQYKAWLAKKNKKTMVSMPRLPFDWKKNVWLERPLFISLFRYTITPQKSLPLVLWKGPGSEMWVTWVGIPSKSGHILNRKIEMKPGIVMHISPVTPTCKTELQ